MTYKDILDTYGIDDAYVHSLVDIPMNTLRSWRVGSRKCPDYVLKLLDAYLMYYFTHMHIGG